MKTNHSKHTAKAVSHDKVTVPAKRRQRRKKALDRRDAVLDGLEQINLHAAGIDVGAGENFVCVPRSSVKAGESLLRTFLTSYFSSNWCRKVLGHVAGLPSCFLAK